jgi:hypothetical protein
MITLARTTFKSTFTNLMKQRSALLITRPGLKQAAILHLAQDASLMMVTPLLQASTLTLCGKKSQFHQVKQREYGTFSMILFLRM